MNNNYQEIISAAGNALLIAVSKTKPAAAIQELYNKGHRDFGENYVQELTEKAVQLPDDIRWHFIGHLQSNKVKYIAPFVHCIHSVDSFKLLQEIEKQAQKHKRTIEVLLQMHIAEEDTKYGMDEKEAMELLEYYTAQRNSFLHTMITGVMGMATFTQNEAQIHREFAQLKHIMLNLKAAYFPLQDSFREISMGMSSDYAIALEEGSTMLRVGSLLFGSRH